MLFLFVSKDGVGFVLLLFAFHSLVTLFCLLLCVVHKWLGGPSDVCLFSVCSNARWSFLFGLLNYIVVCFGS